MVTASPDIVPPAETENLEDAFGELFKNSTSGTGEEELLRIASRYSLQLSVPQMKALLYLEWWVDEYKKHPITLPKSRRIRSFVDRYLELKQYNGSDLFVMKALEYISLRRFINENSMKVNIEK